MKKNAGSSTSCGMTECSKHLVQSGRCNFDLEFKTMETRFFSVVLLIKSLVISSAE